MGVAGSDTALETADVALMADDLTRLPFLLRLSRATLATIRANVGFALAVKALFLALTLIGLSNLWLAILADTGAALLVIANSMRLLRFPER
jgi:Cd2+/Zn2+-exporting ATPase